MELGYVRLSTTARDVELQLGMLVRYGIPRERIYVDEEIGATKARPAFTAVMQELTVGGTIVVVTLDRLGFTVRDCLEVVRELRERGIGIKTLADPVAIDSTAETTVAAKTVDLLALFGQMDKVYLRERAARARRVAAGRGRQRGRPPAVDEAQVAAALADRQPGESVAQVAAGLGVSRATLYRHWPRESPGA